MISLSEKKKQYNINRSAKSAYYKCITQSAFIAFFIGHFPANKLHRRTSYTWGPETTQQFVTRRLSWVWGNSRWLVRLGNVRVYGGEFASESF